MSGISWSWIPCLREAVMEKFIHRENLALYKKCLEEPHTAAEREVLLKLLAEEEQKERRPKKEKN
jgi:hypothetical protein